MGRVSMPQGDGSQMHNRRDYEKYGKNIPNNVNVSKLSENVTLIDKDIKQAYQEIFGEPVERYNAKQKRSDRKIKDYYDHILKSKNGEKPFYEDIVQWGSKDDFTSSKTRDKAKEALIQYVNSFEVRNPNLKLIGAYIHMDEASPHLHIDYIPVAHGYKQGLDTRNSLDRAMKEMGYIPEKENKKNNATKLWKENERAVFGKICQSFGLEVEDERKSRGSLSVDEYKEVRDKMMGDVEKEVEQKKKEAISEKVEIEHLEAKKASLQRDIEVLQRRCADLSTREKKVAEREQTVAEREKKVDEKERTLKQLIKNQAHKIVRKLTNAVQKHIYPFIGGLVNFCWQEKFDNGESLFSTFCYEDRNIEKAEDIKLWYDVLMDLTKYEHEAIDFISEEEQNENEEDDFEM